MGSFSLTPAVRVFQCPHCGETINTSMQQCPFCATPFDHADAEKSAAATSKISQACSDSSYLKVMTGLLVPFFFLQFVPFITLAGVAGFWFLRIAVPVMAVRWFIRYGSIKTADPDFGPARRTALTMGIIGLVVLLGTTYRIYLR